MFQLLNHFQQENIQLKTYRRLRTTSGGSYSETGDAAYELDCPVSDMSVSPDQYLTASEPRMDRNYIRLTSGRTDMSSYESANMENHANYNGALGRYSELGDDDAALIGGMAGTGPDGDSYDADHCHSLKPADGEAEVANKRATVQLTIAAVICLLFMTGEIIGKLTVTVRPCIHRLFPFGVFPCDDVCVARHKGTRTHSTQGNSLLVQGLKLHSMFV